MTIPYRPKPSGSPVIFAGGQVNISLVVYPLGPEAVLVINAGGILSSLLWLTKDGGLTSIKLQCLWLWLTFLSIVLSLQAYAVQGQHAIPQPDVSEGPSVSDPIYLKLRSWGAMPPPYFIPLTLICPAITACYTSPFKTSKKYTHVVYIYQDIFYFFMSHLIFFSHHQL